MILKCCLQKNKGVLTLILRLAHSFTVHCAQDMCAWGAVRTWLVLLGWKPIMEPPFSPYSHPALSHHTSFSLSLALILYCSLPNCKKIKYRNCSLLILTPLSHQLPLSYSFNPELLCAPSMQNHSFLFLNPPSTHIPSKSITQDPIVLSLFSPRPLANSFPLALITSFLQSILLSH